MIIVTGVVCTIYTALVSIQTDVVHENHTEKQKTKKNKETNKQTQKPKTNKHTNVLFELQPE